MLTQQLQMRCSVEFLTLFTICQKNNCYRSTTLLFELCQTIGINETKLDENVSEDEIALEGYTVIRNDRNTSGGGVALFVHSDVLFIKRSDLSCELESLSIELKIQNIINFIICENRAAAFTGHHISS